MATTFEKVSAFYNDNMSELAEALGCTRQNTNVMKRNGRIPLNRARAVERATEGFVTAQEIFEEYLDEIDAQAS